MIDLHTCHADGCRVLVLPTLLMCSSHWFMVPRSLRKRVLETYRPGQEIDKRPSDEYLAAAQAAVDAVALKEGRR